MRDQWPHTIVQQTCMCVSPCIQEKFVGGDGAKQSPSDFPSTSLSSDSLNLPRSRRRFDSAAAPNGGGEQELWTCFPCSLVVLVVNLCFFGFLGCHLVSDSFKPLCYLQPRRECTYKSPSWSSPSRSKILILHSWAAVFRSLVAKSLHCL